MTTRRTFALTLLAALAVTGPLQAADDALANNAALAYYQAYLFLPKLDDAQKSAIKEAVAGKTEIDKDLVTLIDEGRIALYQMYRGTKQSECVWGTEFEVGPNAMLAHVAEARELARLACLRARYRFEQGDTSAAVDDLVATMTLARHTSTDAILVCVLVDYAIEAMVIDVAEGHISKLGKSELEELSKGIDSLPAAVTMSDAVLAEKAVFGNWLVRVLRTPSGKAKLLKLVGEMDGAKNLASFSSEELAEGTQGLMTFYDRLAAMAKLPSAELEKKQQELFKSLDLNKPSGALAELLTPAVGSARRAEEKHLARLAAFKAQIDAALSGK